MKRILTFALSLSLCALACQGCFTMMALASMSDKNGTSSSIGSYATSVYNPISKYMDIEYLGCDGNSSNGQVTIHFAVTARDNYFPEVDFQAPQAELNGMTFDSNDSFSSDIVSDESTTVDMTVVNVPIRTGHFDKMSVFVRIGVAQEWTELTFTNVGINW
jgi:hypothetical protein